MIQRFLRNLVGILTRKRSPLPVTASWRLLPLLPKTCDEEEVWNYYKHGIIRILSSQSRADHKSYSKCTLMICWSSVGVTQSSRTSLTTCLRLVAFDMVDINLWKTCHLKKKRHFLVFVWEMELRDVYVNCQQWTK